MVLRHGRRAQTSMCRPTGLVSSGSVFARTSCSVTPGANKRSFITDADEIGTTLTWARHPGDLRTYYGPASAALHAATGSRRVAEADVRVRRDVDTEADLGWARELGVGVHTACILNATRGSPEG